MDDVNIFDNLPPAMRETLDALRVAMGEDGFAAFAEVVVSVNKVARQQGLRDAAEIARKLNGGYRNKADGSHTKLAERFRIAAISCGEVADAIEAQAIERAAEE